MLASPIQVSLEVLPEALRLPMNASIPADQREFSFAFIRFVLFNESTSRHETQSLFVNRFSFRPIRNYQSVF